MKKLLTVAAFAALSLPAFAQQNTPSTPQIDQRQDRQERRIEQGVRSGELTPRETARLERGQARIREMERKALADGRISRRERAAIDRAQDKQNRLIAQLKHNDRARN